MKTIRNKKGFTLAELLIVVAIIAVLVAIAVPVFTGALTKAQQAVLDADTRAARAQAAATYLLNDKEGTVYYKFEVQTDGSIKVTEDSTATAEVAATQDESTKVVTGTIAITAEDIVT